MKSEQELRLIRAKEYAEAQRQSSSERRYEIYEEGKSYASNMIRMFNRDPDFREKKHINMVLTNEAIERLQDDILEDLSSIRRLNSFDDFLGAKDTITNLRLIPTRHYLEILERENIRYRKLANKDAPEYEPTRLLVENLSESVRAKLEEFGWLESLGDE